MKVWILLVLAGLLLAWSFSRERLEPTDKIRAPPYGLAHLREIYNMMSPQSKEALNQQVRLQIPDASPATLEERSMFITNLMTGQFFEKVYKPATTPITEATIDTFLAGGGGASSAMRAAAKDLLTAYFINQQTPPAAAAPPPAPTPAGPAPITVVPVPIPCPVRERMSATAAPVGNA